jgi:hypothetical protein
MHCLMLALRNVPNPDMDDKLDKRATLLIAYESDGGELQYQQIAGVITVRCGPQWPRGLCSREERTATTELTVMC